MKIIFQNPETETISIIIPAPGWDIMQVALKDVPFGVPFLILPDEEIPSDWSTSHAWEADFSDPTGYGLGNHRWFIQRAQAEIDDGIDVDRNTSLVNQMKQEVFEIEGVVL